MTDKDFPFTRNWAQYLGFFTALPLVLLAYLIVLLAGTPNGTYQFKSYSDPKYWILLTAFTGAFSIALWSVCYYIYVLMKKNLPLNNQEHIWLIVFFTTGQVGMLVFWYLFIWKPINEATDRKSKKQS